MSRKTLAIFVTTTSLLVLLITFESFSAVPASAALQREVGDKIMTYFKQGFMAIQAGNIKGSEQPFIQANTTLT